MPPASRRSRKVYLLDVSYLGMYDLELDEIVIRVAENRSVYLIGTGYNFVRGRRDITFRGTSKSSLEAAMKRLRGKPWGRRLLKKIRVMF